MAQYLQIPTSLDGNYVEKLTFEGKVYILRIRYNARMDRWLMDISDASSNLLLAGIVLTEEWGCTTRFVDNELGIPPGMFLCLDKTGMHQEANGTNMGKDVIFLYVESV